MKIKLETPMERAEREAYRIAEQVKLESDYNARFATPANTDYDRQHYARLIGKGKA